MTAALPAGWQPGRWWRVTFADDRRYPATYPEGPHVGEPHLFAGLPQVWCETSDEAEAREALTRCPGGGILARQIVRTESTRVQVNP